MSDEIKQEIKEDEAASEQVEQQLAPDEIVAGLQAELASSRDQTLRALAEAENARKRAERRWQTLASLPSTNLRVICLPSPTICNARDFDY